MLAASFKNMLPYFQVQLVSDSTNYGKALKMNQEAFVPSSIDSDIVEVYMIWGLGEHDRSSCHKTDFLDEHCQGRTRWDASLDMNSMRAQQALKVVRHGRVGGGVVMV